MTRWIAKMYFSVDSFAKVWELGLSEKRVSIALPAHLSSHVEDSLSQDTLARRIVMRY
jgi:hypothetical protein